VSIRVVLVEDHTIVRQGLRTLLEKGPELEVSGEAGSGREAVELVRKLMPEVVIMDITLPDLNGIEATRRITTELPDVKVLMLSIHSDTRFVVRALRAGASGYLLKDCAFEELISAIRAVVANRTYLSPRIAGVVVKEYLRSSRDKDSSSFSTLTRREREVLQLVAEGQTTKEIAFSLGISVKTVETHRRNLMEKLGTNTLAELIKYAFREGLTSLDI